MARPTDGCISEHSRCTSYIGDLPPNSLQYGMLKPTGDYIERGLDELANRIVELARRRSG